MPPQGSVEVEPEGSCDAELPVFFVESLLGRLTESGEQAAMDRSYGYGCATLGTKKVLNDGDKWLTAHLRPLR